jgi:hypothetical protein
VALVLLADAARAEEDVFCAHSLPEYPIDNPPARSVNAVDDTLRALFIFARHTDAERGNDCGDHPTAWTDSTTLPVWADSLFDDVAVDSLAGWTPTRAPGLTHLFYTMSDPDHPHILLGRVYPQVVVADSTIEWYSTNGAYRTSNQHVLQKVDADSLFTFADFDVDNDDEVDFVFIYYWSPKSANGNFRINPGLFLGISDILQTSLSVEGGAMTVAWGGGATIFPRGLNNCDGPGVARARNRAWVYQVAAHEYDHDLMSLGWPAMIGGHFGVNV